jgi:hypothetical protein
MEHETVAAEVVETSPGVYSARINGGNVESGFCRSGNDQHGRGYSAIMVEVGNGNYTPYVAPPAPNPALAELAELDTQVDRTTEDLYDALIANGVITEQDIPAQSVTRINRKKELRAQL